MTASNGARFSITGSVSGLHPSTSVGAVVIPGETLTLRLEETGSHIYNTKYEIVEDSAAAAPLITTNPADGVPTPLATSPVTLVVPLTGPWSYKIRSTANRHLDGNGNLLWDWISERVIASKPFGVRHILLKESGEFDPVYDWVEAVNELVTATSGGPIPFEEAHGTFRPETYGAVGDGTADDTVAIQAAIDAAIAAPGGVVQFRLATYRTTASLIVASVGATFGIASCALRGVRRACPGYSAASSTIVCLDKDVPIFVVQGGRGVEFTDLLIRGPNDTSATVPSSSPFDALLTDSNFTVAALRLNPQSPQAAIVVDPYHPNVIGGDQYPGHAAYYALTGYYTTAVTIERCSIERVGVGLCLSPSGYTYNAENIAIRDTNFGYCDTAISVGQDQSRNVVIDSCSIGGCLFAVSTERYCANARHGAAPYIRGLNIGCTKYCFYVNTDIQPFIVESIYCESTLSLGYVGVQLMTGHTRATFRGCSFGLWACDARQIDTHLWNFSPVTFDCCTLAVYGVGWEDAPFVAYNYGRLRFRGCKFSSVADKIFPFATHDPALVLLDDTATADSTEVGGNYWFDAITALHSTVALGGGIALTAVAGGEITLTVTAGGPPTVYVGDCVFVTAASPTKLSPKNYDSLAYNSDAMLGTVKTIAGGGADLTIDRCPETLLTGGGNLYTLEVRRWKAAV